MTELFVFVFVRLEDGKRDLLFLGGGIYDTYFVA